MSLRAKIRERHKLLDEIIKDLEGGGLIVYAIIPGKTNTRKAYVAKQFIDEFQHDVTDS